MRPETTWVPYGSTWAALPTNDEDDGDDEELDDVFEDEVVIRRGFRGGSWCCTYARLVRVAFRFAYEPEYCSNNFGFRLCFKGGSP